MAQEWLSSAVDQRTFGAQQARVLDDLNRPNLTNIAQNYLQDAMRYFSRKPFFFSDTDNTSIPVYANDTIYTQGACIVTGITPNLTIFCAMNYGTSAAAGTPIWPTTLFTVPSTAGQLPPPASGTAGTIDDNGGPSAGGIRWANITGTLTTGATGINPYTQLCTVYNINEYQMPIDLIAFTRVEVTWGSNQRLELLPRTYKELRDYDVIRPTPPATYPTYYAWYQQKLYMWPYPAGQYPITLSYRMTPQLATLASDSNFWTTTAEALIRHYAEARINESVIGDSEMAAFYDKLANEEFLSLQSQASEQDVRAPIPASEW